jgi:hypothetical protein
MKIFTLWKKKLHYERKNGFMKKKIALWKKKWFYDKKNGFMTKKMVLWKIKRNSMKKKIHRSNQICHGIKKSKLLPNAIKIKIIDTNLVNFIFLASLFPWKSNKLKKMCPNFALIKIKYWMECYLTLKTDWIPKVFLLAPMIRNSIQ